jgi:hypothetical protein
MESIHNIHSRSTTLLFNKTFKSHSFLSRPRTSSVPRARSDRVINIHVQHRQNRKKEHAPLRPLHDVHAPRAQFTRRFIEDPSTDLVEALEFYREVKDRGKLRFIPSRLI